MWFSRYFCCSMMFSSVNLFIIPHLSLTYTLGRSRPCLHSPAAQQTELEGEVLANRIQHSKRNCPGSVYYICYNIYILIYVFKHVYIYTPYILSASDLSSIFPLNGVLANAARCLGAAGGVAEFLQVLEVVPGHSTEALVVQTWRRTCRNVSNVSKCFQDFRDHGVNLNLRSTCYSIL